MSKDNTRKINKCIGKCTNNAIIHPNSLLTIYNNFDKKKICPINEFNNKFNYLPNCDQISDDQLLKNLITPHLFIDELNLLKFYDIENIDDLIKWIDENKNKKSFETVKRLLNLFIQLNLNNIKIYHKLLIEIIKNIILYYFKYDEKIINKEIDSFFKY